MIGHDAIHDLPDGVFAAGQLLPDIDIGQTGAQSLGSKMITDQKLNVALRASSASHFKRIFEGPEKEWSHEHHLFNYFVRRDERCPISYNHHVYHMVMDSILRGENSFVNAKQSIEMMKRQDDIFEKSLKGSLYPLIMQMKGELTPERRNVNLMLEKYGDSVPPLITRIRDAFDAFEPISDMCSKTVPFKWEENLQREIFKRRYMSSKHLRMDVLMLKTVCVIRYRGVIHVVPAAYHLLILNKLCDWLSVSLAVFYMTRVMYPNEYFERYEEFLREMVRYAYRYGNNFFTICKSLEGLVTGEILIEVDGRDNRSLLDSIVFSLYEEFGYDYYGSELRCILLSVKCPFRNELGCLSKLFGHPFVSIIGGVKTMMEKAREERPVSIDKVAESYYSAIRLLVTNYIKRYNKWPEVRLSNDCCARIRTAHYENIDPNSPSLSKYGDLKLADWAEIEILKNAKFDVLEDFIPYLKDKTITMHRLKIEQSLANKKRIKEGEKKIYDIPMSSYQNETRLLLNYLTQRRESDDHLKYLTKYMKALSEDDWNSLLDYNVIRVVPKEKELKTDFRGFGCQSYENRARCLMQEYNMSDLLDQLVPEQAMTLSEVDLSNKLMRLRRIRKSYKGYTPIYISIDASSWCSRFRDLPVRAVMKIIDQYYNVNIYGSTMEFYENTLYYVADTEATYFWQGQLGGIEGLNQYTWVFVYISQIHTALEGYGCPYQMLCKGDDLRLIVMLPNGRIEANGLEKERYKLMQHVTNTCGELCHMIKINDSYASFHYLAFSKSASIGEVELPQVLRKIQKVYGANNAVFRTLDTYISSTFSNAHSACRAGLNPIPCYLTGLYWASLYLLRDSKYRHRTNDELVALLFTPGVVGGFPIIYLHNMLLRTESDSLSPFIEYIEVFRKICPGVSEAMEKFLEIPEVDEPNFGGMCRDAYSIPIPDRPEMPETYLRKKLQNRLREITTNKNLKELFHSNLDSDYNDLLEVFKSANVYMPRAFAFIFSKSTFGFVEQFVKKFENGQSVIKAICGRMGFKSTRLLREAAKKEQLVHEWRLDILSRKRKGYIPYSYQYFKKGQPCSAAVAQNIRNVLWKKEVLGVTMPAMSHYCYIREEPNSGACNIHEAENHFTLEYKLTEDTTLEQIYSSMGWNYTPGAFVPLIGAVTGSGNLMPNKRAEQANVITHKLAALLSLITWLCTENNNVDKLLLKLFKQVSNVDPSLISVYVRKRRSGTSTHHQRGGGFDPRISQNCLSNNLGKFKGYSTTHNTFRTTGGKVYVNFLQVMAHGIDILVLGYQEGLIKTIPRMTWIVTTDCKFCTRRIQEPVLNFGESELNRFNPDKLCSIAEVTRADAIFKYISINPTQIHRVVDRTVEGLDLQDAIMGYLQVALNEEMTSISRLIDQQGRYVFTREGLDMMKVLHGDDKTGFKISLTELKHMPIQGLYEALRDYMYDWYLVNHSMRSPEEFSAYLMIVDPATLPWYPIFYLLKESWRYTSLVRCIGRVTGYFMPFNVHYTGKTAKDLVVIISKFYKPELDDQIRFIRLSTSEDSHVLSHFSRKVRRHLLACLDARYSLMDHIAMDLDQLVFLYEEAHEAEEGNYTGEEILYGLSRWLVIEITLELTKQRLFEPIFGTSAVHGGIVVLTRETFLNLFTVVMEKLKDLPDEESLINPYLPLYKRKFPIDRKVVAQTLDDSLDAIIRFIYYTEVRIQLIYTDAGCCIETIRANPIEDEPATYEMEGDTHPSINFGLPKSSSRSNKENYIQLKPQNFSLRDNLPQITAVRKPIFAGCDRVRLLPCHFQKVHGIATTTVTYWKELLVTMGIRVDRNHLPTGTRHLSLADGYGGVTGLFASLYKYGHIEYCTLQANKDHQTVPHGSILDIIEDNSNTISYSLQTKGADDLRSKFIITCLEHLITPYDLITCDATYDDDDNEDFLKVFDTLAEIIRLFLVPNGKIISRVLLHQLGSLEGQRLIALIKNYCHELYLFKPTSSSRPHEAYIFGVRNAMDAKINSVECFTLDFLNTYQRWYERITIPYQLRGEDRNIEYAISRELKWRIGTESPGFYSELNRNHIYPKVITNMDEISILVEEQRKCMDNLLLQFRLGREMRNLKIGMRQRVTQLEALSFYEGFLSHRRHNWYYNEEALIQDYITMLHPYIKKTRLNKTWVNQCTYYEQLFDKMRFKGYENYLKGYLTAIRAMKYFSRHQDDEPLFE